MVATDLSAICNTTCLLKKNNWGQFYSGQFSVSKNVNLVLY